MDGVLTRMGRVHGLVRDLVSDRVEMMFRGFLSRDCGGGGGMVRL